MTKFKILIADDDDDDFSNLQEAFAELGTLHDFEHVKNGKELVDRLNNYTVFKQELPDLILLDINMPVMDGLKALELIRSEKRILSIPIVMCSTATCDECKARCRNLGADGFITKSWSYKGIVEIADVINRFLQKKQKKSEDDFIYDSHTLI